MTGQTVSDDSIGVAQFVLDPKTRKITECPQGYKPTLSIYDPEKEMYIAKIYKIIANNVLYSPSAKSIPYFV